MIKFNLLIQRAVLLTFNTIDGRAISSLKCVMLTSKLADNKTKPFPRALVSKKTRLI